MFLKHSWRRPRIPVIVIKTKKWTVDMDVECTWQNAKDDSAVHLHQVVDNHVRRNKTPYLAVFFSLLAHKH